MGFKTDIQNVVDVGIELVDLFNGLNNSFVLCILQGSAHILRISNTHSVGLIVLNSSTRFSFE